MKKYKPEIITASVAVLGWLLIVWGLAGLITIWIWPIGIGIGLLGGVGYKLLWITMLDGLYLLSGQGNEPTGGRGQ